MALPRPKPAPAKAAPVLPRPAMPHPVMSVVKPVPKPATVPPGTAVERAVVLITVMNRLAGLLARELDAVRRGAFGEVNALQEDKRELGGRLDEIGRLLRLDRAGVAALDPDLLGRLKEAGAHLRHVTETCTQTLDVKAEAQKWVVEVVVKTRNQEQRADAAYGRLRKGVASQAPRPVVGQTSTYSASL